MDSVDKWCDIPCPKSLFHGEQNSSKNHTLIREAKWDNKASGFAKFITCIILLVRLFEGISLVEEALCPATTSFPRSSRPRVGSPASSFPLAAE